MVFNQNMNINQEQMRSERSEERVYIKFVNLSDRVVEVIWINFSGQYQRYILLRNKQYVDVNTYKTHPWIAMDVHTKDRLHLDRSFVYNPTSWKEFCQANYVKYPIIPPERRRIVYITLPVYSLRYRTLLQIRDLLKNTDDVDKLDLPNSLIEDLKKVITLKDKVNMLFSSGT